MSDVDDLARKLDALVRLTALQALGERTGAEAIVFLARARLDNDLIAEIVGTSAATVRATMSRVRRSTTKES